MAAINNLEKKKYQQIKSVINFLLNQNKRENEVNEPIIIGYNFLNGLLSA